MSLAVDVKYEYVTNTATPGYFCITVELVITQPGEKIINFDGVHQFGMTDNDVLEFNTTKQKTDYLPHGLAEKFVNLEILYVIESGVKAITRSDFEQMTKLKEIALYGNLINDIPANCFDDLINLKKISLSNNRIKYLPNEVFHQLPSLMEVYISNNNLEAVSSNLFVNNPHMTTISLRGNSLKSIGDGMIIILRQLKNVSLEDNTCISDNFPNATLKALSMKIKEQCSVEDLCLHARIETNTEVQELKRKIEQCEDDKIGLEIIQLSLMRAVSEYKVTKHQDNLKLEFLEDANQFLREENDKLKDTDVTALNELQEMIISLKQDLTTVENGSQEDKSKLEEKINTLININLKQEESEKDLKSEVEQLKKVIKKLKSEVGAPRPSNTPSSGVDPDKMELAYKVLMFAIHKFKENDQNKPSTNSIADKNKNTIELIFHHNM